jgi:hypothetical protein
VREATFQEKQIGAAAKVVRCVVIRVGYAKNWLHKLHILRAKNGGKYARQNIDFLQVFCINVKNV